MHWLPLALCTALLLPTPLLASSVMRCEDSHGRITFTQHGCPETHSQQIQNAHNPRPGSGASVPLASPATTGKTEKRSINASNEITIVGERQDGCGNALTGNARREAIIRKQIRSGMTRNDVESALGKPERITQRNGRTTYHYARTAKNDRRTVAFDQDDCVR